GDAWTSGITATVRSSAPGRGRMRPLAGDDCGLASRTWHRRRQPALRVAQLAYTSPHRPSRSHSMRMTLLALLLSTPFALHAGDAETYGAPIADDVAMVPISV